MKNALLATLGVLLIVVGGIWTLQGLGYVGGSPMTGVAIWAIIGPVLAALGVALVVVTVRGGRGKTVR